MYTILKINEILEDNIIFSKFFLENNNTKFNIKYILNQTKKQLVVQTPKLYIPFGINYNFKIKSLDLSLNDNIETNQFKNFILKLNNKVINYLKKHNLKQQFVPSIKKSKNNYPDRLRLNLFNDVKIYDDNKNIYTGSLKKLYGKFLIHLNLIWCNNNFCGIQFDIMQMMVYPKLMFDDFKFIDDNNNAFSDKFEKYLKMKKNRVPIMAIKHKMTLDGIDNETIQTLLFDKNTKKETSILSEINSKMNNLKTISKNDSINKNIPSKKINSAKVPSLDEIKNGLKNLKKFKN